LTPPARTPDSGKTTGVGAVNDLIWYTGVSVSTGDISVSGFTAAVAGTTARPSGANGRFILIVSFSKDGNYATALNSGTITATPYTPPATYAVTAATTVNGTVTADKRTAAAEETVTLTAVSEAGYEPDAVTVTGSDGIGDVETLCIASLPATPAYTFTMPACDVTVRATFKKTQAQLDREAVEAAKAAIEGGTYRVAQATANDEADVRTWLVNTLNVLFGQSHNLQLRSVETPVVGDIAITAATPAIAGTETAPAGTDGAFGFTVMLAGGAGSATATVAAGVIVATPHASTPVKRIELLSPGTLTVRILNTGNVATGDLTLALSGANADAFTLPSETAGSLPVGGEADITLVPRTDLATGTYKAILTVSGEGIASVSVEITYTVLPTGTEDISQANVLKAGMQNGPLHVSGLTAGKPWSVYSLSGALICRNVAGSDEADISLPVRGVYIVQSGNATVKAAY
jgi:hypothetical protein